MVRSLGRETAHRRANHPRWFEAEELLRGAVDVSFTRKRRTSGAMPAGQLNPQPQV